MNHIGYTISGVQLFGPLNGDNLDAVIFEGWSFDQCGGHVTSINGEEMPIDSAFPFTLPGYSWILDFPTGGYHCKLKSCIVIIQNKV